MARDSSADRRHTKMQPSSATVIRRRQSCEKAIPVTGPPWPAALAMQLPVK
jgi:hypothetical protein